MLKGWGGGNVGIRHQNLRYGHVKCQFNRNNFKTGIIIYIQVSIIEMSSDNTYRSYKYISDFLPVIPFTDTLTQSNAKYGMTLQNLLKSVKHRLNFILTYDRWTTLFKCLLIILKYIPNNLKNRN